MNKAENEEKVIRAKNRIEFLRKIHGLRKKDIQAALGFSRQNYYKEYQNSSFLSVSSLIGITNLFGLSEYDLLHSTEKEFNELPIVKSYLAYSKACQDYYRLKKGPWDCRFLIEIK